VPWSSPRNVILQMSRVAELGPVCRQTAFLRYPLGAGRRVRSHLQQVSGGFSSCESHNFSLDRGLPGAYGCDPCRSRVRSPRAGDDGCLSALDGRFVLKRLFRSSRLPREAGGSTCLLSLLDAMIAVATGPRGAQCCAAVTIFRRAIHAFVDCKPGPAFQSAYNGEALGRRQ
jgi:hypothetical protein